MNSPIVHFALMFQFESDDKATKHIMYNCTCTRASEAGNTKNENIEPQTETLNIECKSIYNASLDAEIVKAECAYGSQAYANWTSAVYSPTAPSTST